MHFDDLLDLACDAIVCVLLRRLLRGGAEADAVEPLIAAAFNAGDASAFRSQLEQACVSTVREPAAEAFVDATVVLATALAPLRADAVSRDALLAAAEAAALAGDASESLACADMAYNLHEMAWTYAALIDAPALASAVALRRLANPQRLDQVHAAAWRHAIERLRDALDRGKGWLEAIDAVELALTLPVQPAAFQEQLFSALRSLAARLDGTPIASLAIAIVVQAPADVLDAGDRCRLIEMLLELHQPLPGCVPSQAAHFMACLEAQSRVDDERLALLAPPPLRPGIAWHDLTLAHQALQAAVPLGRSLLADAERSGEFVLSLTHEAAHAYCLLGPVGTVVSAFRAAISYLEFVLLDLAAAASGAVVDAAHATPLRALPASAQAVALARAQVALAQRATRFASAWTPWLEGIALYVELLADPAQDADEILAPHVVVRSLVDFEVDSAPGDDEAAAERRALAAALEFERFLSAALARHSRLRHIAALAAGDESRVYMPGYLLVRSLVARWESTLGRRVAPVHAARLMLDATRNGSFDALPPLDEPLESFGDRCRDGVANFIAALAALDAPTLEPLLDAVRPRQRIVWRGALPLPAAEVDRARHRADAELRVARLADEVAAVALGGRCPPPQDAEGIASWRRHRDGIDDLLTLQIQLATLLPVGRDDARLLLFEDSGRVATCPRTFAGIGPALPAGDDLNLPRYSIRSLAAADPAREFARIRAGCAERGLARARMTRVVDLVGHTGAPIPAAGASYACAWIDGHWDHVAVGYRADRVDEREYASFLALLRARLQPHPFHAAEGSTLASPAFLADRLAALVPADPAAAWLRAINAQHDAGADGAWLLAAALAQPADAVAAALDFCCADASEAQALANALWAGGMGRSTATPAAHGALAALVLDVAAGASVKPFAVNRSER